MKSYLLPIILSCQVLISFGQKLTLEKASPFTAVKWEKEQPIVQFENDWYQFEKLDQFSKKQLINFCKKQYGNKWQKRFSEDLVEVLQALKYQPNIDVTLQLAKNGVSKTVIGTWTFENRQRVHNHNNNFKTTESKPKVSQKLAVAEALEDINEFQVLLETKSSYSQLASYDYKLAISQLSKTISSQNREVDVNELTHQLAKIMSEIGDRHASIKNEAFNKNAYETYNLKLPFGIAVLNGKIIALKKQSNLDSFTYYDDTFPYLKSIDGMSIETLIDSLNYRDNKAPIPAKWTRGSCAIQNYGALLFKNNLVCPDSVTMVITNRKTDKIETVPLVTNNKGYTPNLRIENYKNQNQMETGDFQSLYKTLDQNIGYMNIPRMFSHQDVSGLEDAIQKALKNASNTKALIIDIRNNPGGTRDILHMVSKYIIQPEQSPWVANVAYLRTDKALDSNENSMRARYLYSYNSDNFTDVDRQAIDQFKIHFEPQKPVSPSQFSSPFYMVLHSGTDVYNKPVYILVNENTFSAASVFTSAFKELTNVTIVGQTTDGSSGNSKVFHLKNSNIRVKVSTMLSFQRNGQTLDGNGTIPDLIISETKKQILEGVDGQLLNLIKTINSAY